MVELILCVEKVYRYLQKKIPIGNIEIGGGLWSCLAVKGKHYIDGEIVIYGRESNYGSESNNETNPIIFERDGKEILKIQVAIATDADGDGLALAEVGSLQIQVESANGDGLSFEEVGPLKDLRELGIAKELGIEESIRKKEKNEILVCGPRTCCFPASETYKTQLERRKDDVANGTTHLMAMASHGF